MKLAFNLHKIIGNSTPLQYSCLENPMDGGPWWATIHGVAKSRTRLHFHFSLSCIGEGNSNPLPCSCLENPRDGGAWGAAVYGVAQSRTRLKQLSSISSSKEHGRRSLVGCSPPGPEELDTTERLHLMIYHKYQVKETAYK